MTDIKVKDQIDAKGDIVDKIAEITTQINSSYSISQTEILKKKSNLETQITKLQAEVKEFDNIIKEMKNG